MDSAAQKIKRAINFKDGNLRPYINAVILMAIFTFLFLGTEYLYVDILSHKMSEDKTVLAQNYALGVSAAGFLLYALFYRLCKGKIRTLCFFFIGLVSVCGTIVICMDISATAIFVMGLILFFLLGLLGSAAFSLSVRMMKADGHLAEMVGISYAIGILLQFINNNLVHLEVAEAVILAVFSLMLVLLIIKNDRIYRKTDTQSAGGTAGITEKDDSGKNQDRILTGVLLIVLVVLMTCIFSTLDNAVTLVHSRGSVNIGQAPRLLLALSGLLSGFIFDIGKRKYMGMTMYCVMMLSTICIAVLETAGPFLAGLVIFYLSAGFFAVFFTTGFMELSRYMEIPELWAGMGRAVNNITAAFIARAVLNLLSSEDKLPGMILVLILFAAASIVTALYALQRKKMMEQAVETMTVAVDRKEKLRKFSEEFSFTERETEVFSCLVDTDDNIQMIAENLHVSRRTLERHISAIYEKTGVKSRVGLMNLYRN